MVDRPKSYFIPSSSLKEGIMVLEAFFKKRRYVYAIAHGLKRRFIWIPILKEVVEI